jgi:ABC-type Zn uptake system ZnuABC Zn-binding protein ZnuA
LLQIPATLDRSRGDIHAAGNPHFLTDPLNAKIVAEHIANAFCQLDSKSCDTYRANSEKLVAELESKTAEWEKRLSPFKGQRIVAYHDTWPYFARRFGLNIDLFLEPKPGIPPTPVHLAEVVSRMKADHIHVILVEPYQNRKTAEAVAADTGATVVDVTQFPGGVKGTDKGYIELMDYLVGSIAKALSEGSK